MNNWLGVIFAVYMLAWIVFAVYRASKAALKEKELPLKCFEFCGVSALIISAGVFISGFAFMAGVCIYAIARPFYAMLQ